MFPLILINGFCPFTDKNCKFPGISQVIKSVGDKFDNEYPMTFIFYTLKFKVTKLSYLHIWSMFLFYINGEIVYKSLRIIIIMSIIYRVWNQM